MINQLNELKRHIKRVSHVNYARITKHPVTNQDCLKVKYANNRGGGKQRIRYYNSEGEEIK